MHHSDNTVRVHSESDSHAATDAAFIPTEVTSTQQVVRSGYLVERLFNTPENNLFNYVKFNLVNDHIKALKLNMPRIMDIGCGLQVARRFLSILSPNMKYYGIDYESTFEPDAVVDLNMPGALETPMDWSPDVVMLLDVLEHLHEDSKDLGLVVKHIADTMPTDAQLIITVPQLYRLDRFKLAHLHYPEHKIRLTQAEWRAIIETHFEILTVQGVGYLSVLPYLPMASRHYKPDNILGRLFNRLRSRTFEKGWIKPVDLFLSRTLGKIPMFKTVSNDILFVVKRRDSNRASH